MRASRKLTGGQGPDVIIEAIGLPSTFRAAVEEVAYTGRVVYIGYAKEEVAYDTRLFVQKELDILGSRNALPGDFQEVILMLEAGRFPVDDAISAIVAPEDVAAMLADWSAQPGKYTKIMVGIQLSALCKRHQPGDRNRGGNDMLGVDWLEVLFWPTIISCPPSFPRRTATRSPRPAPPCTPS